MQLSTLTISLILLLAATLAAVIGYNLWQNRGVRRPMAPSDEPELPLVRDAIPPGVEPLTGSAGRGEPTLGFIEAVEHGESGPVIEATPVPALPAQDAVPHVDAAGARLAEPSLPTGDPMVGPGLAPRSQAAGIVALNDRADCILALALSGPIAGDRLAPMLLPVRRVGAKPVAFEGETIAQTGADPVAAWGPVVPGRMYSGLRAGVLLANRHGPLNAMEFSDFISALQGLADQLSASFDPIPMAAVLERARDLDSICMQLDAQVGLNVDCPEPLSTADLERLAQDQRLTERGNSRYARLGSRGEVLFTVSLADEPGRLTLLLDVPRAPPSPKPWDQLVACARVLAHRLQGQIVDDTGRRLSDPALDRIAAQLEQRYDSLAQAGFPAGSPVALRLFN